MRRRRIIACPAFGLFMTLVMAWPVPMLALHWRWVVHDRSWAGSQPQASITRQDKPPIFAEASRRWLCDWWETWESRRGIAPIESGPRIPGYVALPEQPDAARSNDDEPRGLLPRTSRVNTLTTGWPLRAMAAERWVIDLRPASAALHLREEIRCAADLGGGRNDLLLLPLRPIWFGFVCDVLFFAAVGWGLAEALGAARRRLSRRQGHCPACGYDLKGLPKGAVCPECGAGSTTTGSKENPPPTR